MKKRIELWCFWLEWIGFCSSGQCFSCRFLQIPPHVDTPLAVRLIFPPVGYVMDLMNFSISPSSKCAMLGAQIKTALVLKDKCRF
jgi:hypothetical protein